MKKGRFSEEQMVAMLREAERSSVAAVAKKHGISEQSLYNWRKHFAGMEPSDVRCLRQLPPCQDSCRLPVNVPFGGWEDSKWLDTERNSGNER